VALNQLKRIGLGDFAVNVPGVLFQALMSDSQTRILQNPQVRAVENQKASLKIGDRIPYATGSFQPGVGTVGLNPLVSTQFNFLDTGVNVDITPKVHGRDEVSMHVEVDLSAKSGEVELGGLRQPSVSRRTVVHDIRIREGEISVLGGLLGTQENRTRAGVPGLMEIPGLGRLFGTEKLERNRGELLVVLIPHIVRAPDYSETNLRGVSAGNDQNVKLNFAPRRGPEPAGDAASDSAPAQPPAAAPAAAAEPAPAPPAEATPTPAPAPAPQLTFTPGTVQLEADTPVTVTLQLNNVRDLFSAPMKVVFDPKMLRLESVHPGTLMGADGQQPNFTENIANEIGEATITLNRLPGAAGVTGSGSLLQLTFQALAPGTTTVSVADAALKNTQLQPITVGTPSLSVQVQ
jgi:general secretion pathway protein D